MWTVWTRTVVFNSPQLVWYTQFTYLTFYNKEPSVRNKLGIAVKHLRIKWFGLHICSVIHQCFWLIRKVSPAMCVAVAAVCHLLLNSSVDVWHVKIDVLFHHTAWGLGRRLSQKQVTCPQMLVTSIALGQPNRIFIAVNHSYSLKGHFLW